jgi:integrase
MARIIAPNGYQYTIPKVFPTNYKKLKKITSNWYIQYSFYDNAGKRHVKIYKSGINTIDNINDRIEFCDNMINILIDYFKMGYNPINKKIEASNQFSLNENMMFIDALKYAHSKAGGEKKHKDQLMYLINRVQVIIENDTNYKWLKIKEIKKIHIKDILEKLNISDIVYNKSLSYLSMLYSALVDDDILEYNIIKDIKKKKIQKNIRAVLSDDDFVKICEHLQNSNYSFFRYVIIFFYSGARTTELLQLQKKHINIENQEIKIIIKKGKIFNQVIKAIPLSALPYWKDLYQMASENDFIFSKGLLPGAKSINPDQITKRWYRLIKKKFNISEDFYSLKHKFLDYIDGNSLSSENLASIHASHTSNKITNSVYLVNKKQREIDKLKKL